MAYCEFRKLHLA